MKEEKNLLWIAGILYIYHCFCKELATHCFGALTHSLYGWPLVFETGMGVKKISKSYINQTKDYFVAKYEIKM